MFEILNVVVEVEAKAVEAAEASLQQSVTDDIIPGIRYELVSRQS